TSYTDKGPKPDKGKFKAFGHVTFWAAAHYCARLGFKPLAYRGLETGSRQVASHVVQQNRVIFVFESMLEPFKPEEMGQHLIKHGDGVKDIAFEVEDLDGIYKKAIDCGAAVVREPWTESDKNGSVRFARMKTYGDTTHTFFERSSYTGLFLPNFVPAKEDPLLSLLPEVGLQFIDHIVGNQPNDEMAGVADWWVNAVIVAL
uniref:4-hydroxyphenylpyruvate dioxygenase n=1 Tax=Macrostomum lignano TaxID=282301 RepID=A0A1I8IJD7_9PLAT